MHQPTNGPCLFCATGAADREYDHRLLGPRPCCSSCDPGNITRRSVDALERITGTLVAGSQTGLIDLGDEREVDEHLRHHACTDDEISLFQERAVEAARRQLQRTASRFHPFLDRCVEAVSLSVMLVGLLGLYVVTNPAAENHSHVDFAQVQR